MNKLDKIDTQASARAGATGRGAAAANRRVKPAKPGSKASVYARIRSDIIFCEIAPGTPINERELASRYNISRTPLREILVKLAHQRLVVLEPKKGATVAPVDFATARALYEVRLPLERATAALAAVRATPADVTALRELIATLERHRENGDLAAFITTDRAFHDALARIAANPMLYELLEDLHCSNLRFWYYYRNSVYHGVMDVEHLARIVTAVECKQPQAAADAMAEHIIGYQAASEEHVQRSIAAIDRALRTV
jgi:DNA-binding GntR family transcriptional regulator